MLVSNFAWHRPITRHTCVTQSHAKAVRTGARPCNSCDNKLQCHDWCVPVREGKADERCAGLSNIHDKISIVMWCVFLSGKARLMSALRPAEGGLLWRTAKVDVLDEIKLPQQTHRMTYLTLNAIERHFYIAQHKVPFLPTPPVPHA